MTIFITTFNDSTILGRAIDHYKSRFPGAKIVIYDNFSTDNTVLIARQKGCEVKQFYTANKMDDQAVINVKNNCWKGETGWCIVCDADELLDIYPENLNDSFTVISAEVIDMIGGIYSARGVRYPHCPRKMMCFNAKEVRKMNYGFGCHTAYPFGDIYIYTMASKCITTNI